MSAGNSTFIRLDRVYKVHRVGDIGVAALGGASLEVARGAFAAVVGPSGAGKSTILNLIGGVDTPTAGLVSVGGTDLSQLDAAGLSAYRRTRVGFLWQGTTKNLIPYLTVAQNGDGVRAARRVRRAAVAVELPGAGPRTGRPLPDRGLSVRHPPVAGRSGHRAGEARGSFLRSWRLLAIDGFEVGVPGSAQSGRARLRPGLCRR